MYFSEGSKPAISRRLALFHNFPTEVGVEQCEWIDVRPVSNTSHGGVVEFNLSGANSNYLDLKRTRIFVRARILQQDGSLLEDGDKVGLVNLPLHSIWNQVDISLQQQNITSSVSTNYPYKAYIDRLLQHGISTDRGLQQSQLFLPDSSGFFDDSDSTSGGNTGLFMRSQYTRNSSFVDLEGPIYSDICQQERYILNGVRVGFKFWPSRESFCLMSAETPANYRLEIEECILRCCYVKINPGVLLGHSEALLKQPALYPYRRSDIKCFAIPAGQFHMNVDDVFQGEVPERLVVGLVSSQAYSGSYTKNPFNFAHFNCCFSALYVDGKSVPTTPFEPNFKENNFVSSYLSLFGTNGAMSEENEMRLTRDDYAKGFCLYVFDINRAYDSENNLPL
ncbi:hypothetical protein FSP39_001881 [Pinctada imbricata]|uniref:Uncharacterized protein n=1 Tax=Pinctada imbricata TaxID=66713 RepID=A0AA88XK32_PINIB|nr:hypothetical protein FSP39_001881 [Pinctada imbricata]